MFLYTCNIKTIHTCDMCSNICTYIHVYMYMLKCQCLKTKNLIRHFDSRVNPYLNQLVEVHVNTYIVCKHILRYVVNSWAGLINEFFASFPSLNEFYVNFLKEMIQDKYFISFVINLNHNTIFNIYMYMYWYMWYAAYILGIISSKHWWLKKYLEYWVYFFFMKWKNTIFTSSDLIALKQVHFIWLRCLRLKDSSS